MQRTLDRVLRRLVGGDAAGILHVVGAQRGADEIERLADAQLDAQLVVHVERAGRSRPHQQVGVGAREVADQDRDAFAEATRLAAPAGVAMCAHESLVHRVEPAAGSGSVHDVVVDQRERVQQLERGTDVDDDRIVVAPTGADERAVTERRAQTLPAREHEIAQCRERSLEADVDRRPPHDLGAQDRVDPRLGSLCDL